MWLGLLRPSQGNEIQYWHFYSNYKKEELFFLGIQAGKIEAEAPESLPDGEYNTEKVGLRHTEKEFHLSLLPTMPAADNAEWKR